MRDDLHPSCPTFPIDTNPNRNERRRSGYTCAHCNKYWRFNDPGFQYFRPFGEGNYLVKEGYARVGDPMNLIDAITGKPISGGYDSLGWFARCVDREQCERYRRNNHAGQPYEALTLADEVRTRSAKLASQAALL